jgi:hypothetical protein
MDDIKELAERIFRDRIVRARHMNPGEKLSAGFELFEFACGIARGGIKHQFPDADDAEVEQELRRRLAIQARVEVGQWMLDK